ncbi:Spo0E family sporulation regulatory protein-aspartic acid phosphatase [Neobacillus sp. 19]|uniref:Spo0E family sporulation regulatory protein-aspartic acid phosphatase n=1 Tax=Neobacillus sp. 19 TaxID=3394458 RepID=UPI003BF682B5
MSYLLNLIEVYRNEMFELAEKYGPTSTETLECSQHLDHLLNELMKTEKKRTHFVIKQFPKFVLFILYII